MIKMSECFNFVLYNNIETVTMRDTRRLKKKKKNGKIRQ